MSRCSSCPCRPTPSSLHGAHKANGRLSTLSNLSCHLARVCVLPVWVFREFLQHISWRKPENVRLDARDPRDKHTDNPGSIFREPEAKEVPLPPCKKHGHIAGASAHARSAIRRPRTSNRRAALMRSPDSVAELPPTSFRVGISGTSTERQQAFSRLMEDFQASHALHSQDNNSASSGDDTVVPSTLRISDRPQSRRGPFRRWLSPGSHNLEGADAVGHPSPRPSLRRVGHRSINSPAYNLPADRTRPTRPTIPEASNHFRSILDPVHASSAANGLGDRDRSISPVVSVDENQWNHFLNSITPDPRLPSASSSFESSAAAGSSSTSLGSSPTSEDNARSSLRLPLLDGLTADQWSSQRRQATLRGMRQTYRVPPERCPWLQGEDHSADCPLHTEHLPDDLLADVGHDLRQLHVLYESGRLPVEHFQVDDFDVLARFQSHFDAFTDSTTLPGDERAGNAWEQLRRAWWPLRGPQVRTLCELMAEADQKLGTGNEISGEIERVLHTPYLWLATGRDAEHHIQRLQQHLQDVAE